MLFRWWTIIVPNYLSYFLCTFEEDCILLVLAASSCKTQYLNTTAPHYTRYFGSFYLQTNTSCCCTKQHSARRYSWKSCCSGNLLNFCANFYLGCCICILFSVRWNGLHFRFEGCLRRWTGRTYGWLKSGIFSGWVLLMIFTYTIYTSFRGG